jgi:hypothetical protein
MKIIEINACTARAAAQRRAQNDGSKTNAWRVNGGDVESASKQWFRCLRAQTRCTHALAVFCARIGAKIGWLQREERGAYCACGTSAAGAHRAAGGAENVESGVKWRNNNV